MQYYRFWAAVEAQVLDGQFGPLPSLPDFKAQLAAETDDRESRINPI
jgi:hypothetical protein